jgi:hypothetical protein
MFLGFSLSFRLLFRVCFFRCIFEDLLDAIWVELEASSLKEFILELDPMQSESMKECLHQIHHH